MPTARQCRAEYGYEFVGDPDASVVPRVVELMRTTPMVEQRTPEWFEMRRGVLSASDVASAIGTNKYQTPKDLLRDKVFGVAFRGNAATAHGQKYEPVAIERFCRETGHTVFEFGLVPHPEYRYLAGSPDGICADGSAIEVKCPLSRRIEHAIPDHYYPQVQTVLEIVDAPPNRCYFIQYKPAELEGNEDGEVFDVLEVARDRGWFMDLALPRIRAFWKDVLFYREHSYELDPCTIVPGMYE